MTAPLFHTLTSLRRGCELLILLAIAAWGHLCPAVAVSGSADVGPQMQALIEADWIEQDRSFVAMKQEKPKAPARPEKVTTAEDAAGGCDGIKNGHWGFHTASGEQDPWWQVDLGDAVKLDRVVIYNRTDHGKTGRAARIQVLVADEPECRELRGVYQHDGSPFFGVHENKPLVVDLNDKNVTGRIVRLAVAGRCSFALDEIEVYASADPQKNIALGKPADQKSVGQYSWPGTMPEAAVAAIFGETPAPAGSEFALPHLRQVVERGKALAERIKPKAGAGRLAPLVENLAQIDRRVAELEKAADPPIGARKQLYLDARRVVRRIAFCNPLLDIDRILFIKRHDAAGVFHMCDQFYGCNAKPGGGLYVLSDPFGPDPKLINVLENSVVENGRLAGKKLEGGSFLSPELSFDGRTILFAYSEAGAWSKYQGKEAYEWTPECSYHTFKCNADGTGLVQLTDGTWNDFDPCFLPNGRIVFISERRGGYLRCGRHCPVYTMFSMRPDGSDIICLSFHETHEWQPSVNNAGMLVYTRWDYVDRDTNIAHHIWTCYPDGRDPRSFHGNYPVKRESRPWMEMSIRAVPGSHKYVASTGAHHGHEFGSLVLIDPRVEDDGAESQLERLTPEVPFPEAEGRPTSRYMSYGTPWPLSEDDYLAAYDANAKNHGIYWIDRHGNKELLYRDPSIASISPIPFRPRPVPPLVPSGTRQAAEDVVRSNAGQKATIAVMNVYESDFAWPEGTKIDALRVIQVLPKSTAPPNLPRIGIANQTNARAVLGTVPVEADGSVYFEAPVGMPIYFQAVDERGLAVQSMRSATYVHPGERMTCQGCHERKHQPPRTAEQVPLALRRPPSPVEPDVEGSNPFTYVRLVQPVLDRNCVGCHQEKKALDLTGKIEGGNGWTRSYTNLAAKYGFYFHVSNGSINQGIHGGSRTVPGQFGAKASGLMKYLDASHYGVKLSEEDFHRITLWLDCNSEFFGAYENTEAQSRGEAVKPSLE
ncbi:MAG: discoidin domain-containing protein [Pirellulales bacterium]|nr:discoidin domain-containing protein [Pirellulales bacterium]